MTYQEYRQKSQAEFNALPIFFAFSNQQFKEQMEARGLTENDTDKIYRFGNTGGFYLRSDAQVIHDYFDKQKTDHTLEDLMQDHDFAVSAFRYEMDNHEYAINHYQGDWEVVGCFTKKELEFSDDKNYKDYMYEAGLEDLIPWYQEARREHMKAAEDWM
jgi:hypothetical protein